MLKISQKAICCLYYGLSFLSNQYDASMVFMSLYNIDKCLFNLQY